MTTTSPGIETTWRHTTAEIALRTLEQTRTATAEECAALAALLDIPAVESLVVHYRIAAVPRGRYKLTGTLEAKVVQSCVVTLDPVASRIDDRIDVEFRPAGDLPDAVGGETIEEAQAILDAEEFEPIEDHLIAVGRIVVETLTAALPAYPRAPGAALEQHEASPAGGGTANPFSALAGWKPKSG